MTRKGRRQTQLSEEGKSEGLDLRLFRSWLRFPAPRPTPAFTCVERRNVGGVYAPEEDELPGDAVVMLG